MDSNDVRNYVSYLALKQRVSSSTQNQAFNALLFLFKNVLNVELGDLGDTVRAKRGPKLPMVLTVEEVRELFKQAKGKESSYYSVDIRFRAQAYGTGRIEG